MRPVIIILGILVIVLGVFGLQQYRTGQSDLAAAHEETARANDSLQTTRTELTTYRAQQTALVEQLQHQLTTTTAANAATEDQLQQTRQRLETTTQTLNTTKQAADQQQVRLGKLEQEKQELTANAASLENIIAGLHKELATLTRPAALPVPPPPPEDNKELTALRSQWNSLPAVQNRSRELRRQLRDERIAAWKRRDAEGYPQSNRGLMMRAGEWLSVPAPAYPAQ